MVISTQGLPPIVVNRFEGVQTDLQKSPEEFSAQILAKSSPQIIENTKSAEKNQNDITGKDARVLNYNDLADKLGKLIDNQNVAIEFRRDDTTKKMIMRLVDTNTKEILNQFPPEITLKIARIVAESGQLTNAKV